MDIQVSRGGRPGGIAYLPGALCVGLGLLVYFEPQVLVTMVAGIFVLFGIMLLLIAHRIRKGGIGQILQQRMRDY